MGKRRAGRVAALQILYQVDAQRDLAGGEPELDDVVRRHFAHFDVGAAEDVREFAAALCQGVLEAQQQIDRLIEQASEHWRLDRMSRVDRNVLRIAAFELLTHADVPPRVAINEAIEIAKAFGSTDSGAFINGVLDRVLRDVQG